VALGYIISYNLYDCVFTIIKDAFNRQSNSNRSFRLKGGKILKRGILYNSLRRLLGEFKLILF